MNNHQKKKRSAIASSPVAPMKLWQDRAQSEEVTINILPLIDVIFCILTFFILGAVSLSRQQAINLDLPKAQTGTSQMQQMLVVSLDETGNIYLEKQLTNKTRLNQAIVNYYQQNPSGLVVLHASRNTNYSNVIEILDLLKLIGGDRVALATLPGESNSNNEINSAPGLPQNNLELPGNSNIPSQPYSISPNSIPLPNSSVDNNNLPTETPPVDNNLPTETPPSNNNNLPTENTP